MPQAGAAPPQSSRKRGRSEPPPEDDEPFSPSSALAESLAQAERVKLAWLAAFLRVKEYDDVRGIRSECARDLGVRRQLFAHHYEKWRSTGVIHETRHGPAPNLGVALEEALVRWIRGMIAEFTSPTPQWVREKAKELAVEHGIDPSTVGGDSWYMSFLHRHPQLRLRTPQEMEHKRIEGPTTVALQLFFMHLSHLMTVDKRVRGVAAFNPAFLWNVDETWMDSMGKVSKVCGVSRARALPISTPTHESRYLSLSAQVFSWDGEHVYIEKRPKSFHVTLTACGSASGSFLPPSLIFEGKKLEADFSKGAPDARISVSPKGYQDGTTWLEWVKHFIKDTKGNCILLSDGHVTRRNNEALKLLEEAHVHVLTLPPHTTHLLQPLDVAFFKLLKTTWTDVRGEYERKWVPIDKTNMAAAMLEAWKRATAPRGGAEDKGGGPALKNGFAKAGIFPLAENVALGWKEVRVADEVARAKAAGRVPVYPPTAGARASAAADDMSDESSDEDEGGASPVAHNGAGAAAFAVGVGRGCLTYRTIAEKIASKSKSFRASQVSEILTSDEHKAAVKAKADEAAKKAGDVKMRADKRFAKQVGVGTPPATKKDFIARANATPAKKGRTLPKRVLDNWSPTSGPGLKVKLRYSTKGAGGERGEVRGTFNLDHRRQWDKTNNKALRAKAKAAKPPKRRKEHG